MSRADFIRAAREELGTPFHHQGRVSGAGVDCSGLVQVSSIKVGLTPRYERTDYPRIPRRSEFIDDCNKAWDRIQVDYAGEASLLCFWLSDRTKTYHFPQHLGIITRVEPDGRVWFIHSVAEEKRVQEHRLDRRWRVRACAAFEVPGLEPLTGPMLGDVLDEASWQQLLAS